MAPPAFWDPPNDLRFLPREVSAVLTLRVCYHPSPGATGRRWGVSKPLPRPSPGRASVGVSGDTWAHVR